MNRQARWKLKQYKAGNCITCGLPRTDDNGDKSPYKRECVKCAKRRKLRQRKMKYSQPWKAGLRGRPPKVT